MRRTVRVRPVRPEFWSGSLVFSRPVRTNAGIAIRLAQTRVVLSQIRRVRQRHNLDARDQDPQIADGVCEIPRPERVPVFYLGALSDPFFELLFERCELAAA